MPKLLLSVRNALEANLALEAGVDLIDIKEPSAGPLGAASAAVIAPGSVEMSTPSIVTPFATLRLPESCLAPLASR